MLLFLKNFLLKNCLFLSLLSNPEKLTVRGHSMEPLIKEGQEIFLLNEYYKNNTIEKHDIVVLSMGLQKNKIIKKVYGIPGDKFSVVNDGTSCSIQINNKIVKNNSGIPFQLRAGKCGMLALYAKDYNGVIPGNAYVVLGEMVDGSNDSSSFGFTSRDQILGKACF